MQSGGSRAPLLPALLLLVLASAGWLGCGGRGVETVVLVTFDTLHVNAVGPYNPEVDSTPALDWFAAHGVRFESVWTQVPLTLPAHTTILSGLEPPRHGAMLNGDRVPDEVITLPEILRSHGWATAAFTSLGVLKPNFNLDQGFDHYDAAAGSTEGKWYRSADEIYAAVEAWWSTEPAGPRFLWIHLSDPHAPYLAPDAPPDAELRLDGELVGRYLLASLARYAPEIVLAPGERTLSWVPVRRRWPDETGETKLRLRLLAAERLAPYLTDGSALPEGELDLTEPLTLTLFNPGPGPARIRLPFRGSLEWPSRLAVAEAYRAEVAHADAHLARLRDLISPGLDRALWIVASDHGEGLWGQGVVGHATYVFEDQLRALWMLAGPGIPRGRTVAGAGVLLADVTPTVLDLLDLPIPTGLDGVSRRGCWEEGECRGRPTWWAYGASNEGRELTGIAVFAPPFKCLWQRAPRSGCFDLAADPWETDNLAVGYTRDPETMPQLVRGIGEQIEERKAAVDAALQAGPAAAAEDLEMLRDLGYVN